MRIRIILLVVGILYVYSGSSAQEAYTFQNNLRDTVHLDFDQSEISSHYLGADIALKYHRLKEIYTYVEARNVQSPVEKTMVTKPTIYYSLKKLNTYYKKQLRKGIIDSSSAVERLGWFFDVGFSIYEQDTSDFEKALKGVRKPDQIADLFAQVILE